MKTAINLLLAEILLAFGCSIGNAQIIYSNSFNGGAVTINGTVPTVANAPGGGVNNASWIFTYTNALDGGWLANGAIGTNAGSALLPFTPQPDVIYFLNASITLPASMNNWIGLGFAQSAIPGTNQTAERFTDSNVKGDPWMNVNVGKTVNFFGGPQTSVSSAAADVEPAAGTYTLTIVLNTSGSKWTTAAYVNGVVQGTNVVGGTQLGTNIVYGANPVIGYVGFTQQPFTTTAGIQWNSYTLTAVPVPPADSTSTYTAVVNPNSVLVANFQGWGTSLDWWANVVGGYTNRAAYISLIFDTLKLNIVRYKIGGGQNPAVNNPNTPYKAMMQGFELTNGVWNWNADQNQRWILQQAEAHGANLVEALAVSAPWWMCVSSNVDGNMSGTNNLQVNCEMDFAIYLATVISNLMVLDGDHFNSVIPMNEPSLGTVGQVTNGYETCHMSNDQQQRVIADLRAQLNIAAPSTQIDAPGDFDEYEAYNDLTAYSATILSDLALFSTHTYEQNDPANLAAEAASQHKPLWVAEYGDSDSTGLTTAKHIYNDITGMKASAWVYWMAVNSDAGNAFLYNGLVAPTNSGYSTSYGIYEKFYVMGQFSEFIRPGYEIISVNDANTLAAYNSTNATLVLVAINTNTSGFTVTYNLNSFPSMSWQVTATQTASGENMTTLISPVLTNGQFTASVPASSVTTFVLSLAPAGLVFTNVNGAAGLSWNYGTLQTATNVAGPYTDMPGVTSPYQVPVTNGQQFFRIREK